MTDKFGFKSSDMTSNGWRDYQRQIGEVAAQRHSSMASGNNPGNRVHCRNGYVDVIWAKYSNGSSVNMTVDELRTETRAAGKYVYDYNYR